MVFSNEDKIIIKYPHEKEGVGARRIVKRHSEKNWVISTVSRFLKHLKDTFSIDRKPGSGRPKTVRTHENVINQPF